METHFVIRERLFESRKYYTEQSQMNMDNVQRDVSVDQHHFHNKRTTAKQTKARQRIHFLLFRISTDR